MLYSIPTTHASVYFCSVQSRFNGPITMIDTSSWFYFSFDGRAVGKEGLLRYCGRRQGLLTSEKFSMHYLQIASAMEFHGHIAAKKRRRS